MWEYYRALPTAWGAHAIIFIYLFFPAERAYTPVIFGCAFCRIMQSP